MKRPHVHVAVEDLAAFVRFYSALFAAEPTVAKPDYAKWMLDDPRVNFAVSTRGKAGGLDHLGIQVETPEELREVHGRLSAADRPVLDEGATTCCYAQSEKSWISDPQGLAWETFLTSGESTVHGDGADLGAIRTAAPAACCAPATAADACCAPAAEPAPAAPDGCCGPSPEFRAMTGRPYNVLFLCTGNSARSILAEALLNQLGGGRFKAFSAGSFPKGRVHLLAVALLKEQGLYDDGMRSKSWDEFARPDAPVMDFVFTVCDQAAGEACSVWPGRPVTAHWGIPDPAAVDGSEAERMLAFREACRTLDRRLRIFVALPIAALDRLALTRRVEAIGRMREDAPEGRAS